MKRKYLHRIEVWLRTAQDEAEGGGQTVVESKLSDSWCTISTIATPKLTDYGLDLVQKAIRIKCRYRTDLDYEQPGLFFKYRGSNWFPTSVTHIDLEEEELEIIASSEQ